MKIKASLPPFKVRFNKICKNYAMRTLQMHEKHPIRLRVSSSFSPFANEIKLDWSKFLDWNKEENNRNYIQNESIRRKRRRISKKKKQQVS